MPDINVTVIEHHYDPDAPNSFIAMAEGMALALFLAYEAWNIHPAIAIASGILVFFVYHKTFSFLRKNRKNPAVRTFVWVYAIVFGVLYGFIFYWVTKKAVTSFGSNVHPTRDDPIWDTAGFVFGFLISFFSRKNLLRVF